MSRRPRVKLDQPVAYYHVMTRTAQQEMYLGDGYIPGFKNVILKIFKKMAEIYYVDIHAWVIMDNHYHLCLEMQQPFLDPEDVKTRFERLESLSASPRRWQPELTQSLYHRFTDLSKFMSSVNSRIAKAFNRARGTKGHLWGGRFRSKIIEDDPGLMRVMSYIEHNPVRAGMCKVPSAFPWCSAGRLRKRINAKTHVDMAEIDFLKYVAPENRARAYIEFVDDLARRIDGAVPVVQREVRPPVYRVDDESLHIWRKQFREEEPENWSSQAFGSKSFHQVVARLEETKIKKMTQAREETVKRRRNENSVPVPDIE